MSSVTAWCPPLSATSAAARRRLGHDVSFGEAHTGDGSVVRRCHGCGVVSLFLRCRGLSASVCSGVQPLPRGDSRWSRR